MSDSDLRIKICYVVLTFKELLGVLRHLMLLLILIWQFYRKFPICHCWAKFLTGLKVCSVEAHLPVFILYIYVMDVQFKVLAK